MAAALAALRVLRESQGELRMRTEFDLLRVVVAANLGGLIVAVPIGLVGALSGVDEVAALIAGSFVDMTASLILWLPLAMRGRDAPSLATWPERAAQWTLLVTATLTIFATSFTTEFPYVVLVLLMWAGLRLSLLETLLQLIVVRLVITHFTAMGKGPYVGATHDRNLPDDLQMVYVQIFLITCSVAVVALNISSARARAESRREALAKADQVAERKLNTVFEALEAERSALEEMREVDRVKDAFVSTVSHELRTPITNIIGYTEMLEDGDFGRLSPDQSEATVRIGDNGRRLLSLIDDLLDLSRLRAEKMEIAQNPVDLVAVVRAGEQAILPRLRSAEVSLEMDLPPYPVTVTGEAEKLERVLVNLMSNAVKFTPPLGRVAVRLTQEGTWAIIEVSDTGYGIPEEDLDRLFSQFFRSSVSQEKHIQGTGLGLSIVRSIVESHGGQVEVASRVNVGTTFRVYLPT
ncbi:sensor histidine kinase [Nocardioides daphniae]|uniref:histidine kinase n=1 Tax=Nocardioides daphniae TaxID=402297 RepID=A0A4P7UBW2_9ACTN|nr:HAMP domain-containing sensor histidine kinase [Nocardioides daphniae]QCC76768.1 HAMP domain-containing histidine kinase [Nocardioides daphniae]